jgi:hypothetical protein
MLLTSDGHSLRHPAKQLFCCPLMQIVYCDLLLLIGPTPGIQDLSGGLSPCSPRLTAPFQPRLLSCSVPASSELKALRLCTDNLSTVMSSDIYWNESLSSATCENGSNWCNYSIVSSPGSTDPLQDILEPPLLNVSPAPNPTPTCNGQGSGSTRYRSIPQVIRVGSSTTGAGVQAQSDTLGYYVDHGQHDSIQSPTQPPQ